MLTYRTLTQEQYDQLVGDFIKITESLHAVVQDVGDGKNGVRDAFPNESASDTVFESHFQGIPTC